MNIVYKKQWTKYFSLVLALLLLSCCLLQQKTVYASERATELCNLNISYYLENTDRPIASSYKATLPKGEAYSVASPEIDGYELIDPDQKTVEGNIQDAETKISVFYKDVTAQAEYTVRHIGRLADGTNEWTMETGTFTGQVGSVVNVEGKEFEGYTREPSDMRLTITADGKACKDLYYVKNLAPSIIFITEGSYIPAIVEEPGTDIRAQIEALPTPTKQGYEFGGWETAIPTTMPEETTVIRAKWKPGQSTYTVQFYFENVNDENYTWDKTLNETRTAVTGTEATVTQADMDLANEQIAIADGTYDIYQQGKFYGFDYSHCANCTVAADGSSILKLYYDREIWTFCLMDNLVGTHAYDRSYLTKLTEFNSWEKKVWKEFSGKYGSSFPADFPTNDELIAQAMRLKESADTKYQLSYLKYAGHTEVYVNSNGHGGTFDDDDELRHASWCSFGYFGAEDKDKPGSHTLHAYPALSEGSYNFYITWKGEKLGVHGTVPEDFETVHTQIAGPSSSSIGPGLIAPAIEGFTYVGGEMQSYSESDKCRTTGILYAPPTTGFLGDFHGPGCTCEGYMKVEEEENWDSELQACRLDTDAHLDLSTGGTKRLKVGQYTTYFMRREQYNIKFVSLEGEEEKVLRTVEDVYYEQPLNAVPVSGGGTENILAWEPAEEDIPDHMEFGGWYISSDLEAGNAVTDDMTMPAGELTLYAKWAPEEYTVSFDSKGGSDVAAQKVPLNGYAQEPEAPERDGYEFIGWVGADNELWSFEQPVTQAMTLYAWWKPIPVPEGYAVKHIMRSTGQILATEKGEGLIGDQIIAEALTARDEAYVTDSYIVTYPQKQSLILSEDGPNEITFYYDIADLKNYTVSYLLEGTAQKLHEDKTVTGTDLSRVTELPEEIEGYAPTVPYIIADLTVDGENHIIFYYTEAGGASLTVSKIVTGKLGDHERDFTVEITLKDKDGEPVSEGVPVSGDDYEDGAVLEFVNGTAEIALKDGESAVLEDLPSDGTFTVEEISVPAGYEVTYNDEKHENGITGELEENSQVEIGNNRDEIPMTALDDEGGTGKILILFAGALLAVSGGVLIFRRRRHSL